MLNAEGIMGNSSWILRIFLPFPSVCNMTILKTIKWLLLGLPKVLNCLLMSKKIELCWVLMLTNQANETKAQLMLWFLILGITKFLNWRENQSINQCFQKLIKETVDFYRVCLICFNMLIYLILNVNRYWISRIWSRGILYYWIFWME